MRGAETTREGAAEKRHRKGFGDQPAPWFLDLGTCEGPGGPRVPSSVGLHGAREGAARANRLPGDAVRTNH